MALLPCVLLLLPTRQPSLISITHHYHHFGLNSFQPTNTRSNNVVLLILPPRRFLSLRCHFPQCCSVSKGACPIICCIMYYYLFPPFLLPLPVVRSLSNAPYTIHRTPPRYHHIRFTLIPLVPLSSRHHRSSSRIFCRLSIHPSIHPPHCHILQTYLCITIFIHSHTPFTSSSFLQLYYPLLRAWAVAFPSFFLSFIATILTCQLVH